MALTPGAVSLATKKKPDPNSFATQSADYLKKQQGAIASQFAQMRDANQARRLEAERQAQQMLDRSKAVSGGFGGAATKLQAETIGNIQQGFSAEDSALRAQEVAAKTGVQEAERGRQEAGRQFDQQFKFAVESWGKEFDENRLTNIVNAATALANAGLDSEGWTNLYRGLRGVYGQERTSGVGGIAKDVWSNRADRQASMERAVNPFGGMSKA